MKTFSSKFVQILVAAIVVFQAFVVYVPIASAQSSVDEATKLQFCNNLSSIEKSTKSRLNSNLQKDNSNALSSKKITSQKQELDEELISKRNFWDIERELQYKALLNNSQNQNQMDAINVFKSQINSLTGVRRDAVDKAIDEYYKTILIASNDQAAKLNSARKNFANSIDSNFSKAKSECQAKKPVLNVRSQFIQNTDLAKSNLKISEIDTKAYEVKLNLAKATQSKAIDVAEDNFLNGLEIPKKTLVLVLQSSNAKVDQFGI